MGKEFRKPASDRLVRQMASMSVTSRMGKILLQVPISDIKPNPSQPRMVFEESSLEELAASIREKGILEPLLGRENENGTFTLIAGERRLRAAELAGLNDVPLIPLVADDNELLQIALIENIQRVDLDPISKARACQRLIHMLGTQEKAAEKLGIKRSTLADIVRILSLGDEVIAVCAEKSDLSHKELRRLLDFPEAERLNAARQLTGKTSEKSTSPIRKMPAVPKAMKLTGKTDADSVFTLTVKFRKDSPSDGDVKSALFLGLVELEKQSNPDVRDITDEEVRLAVNEAVQTLNLKLLARQQSGK